MKKFLKDVKEIGKDIGKFLYWLLLACWSISIAVTDCYKSVKGIRLALIREVGYKPIVKK